MDAPSSYFRGKRAKHQYTLLELLAVLVLAGLMMTFAMKNFNSEPQVDTGAQMLAQQVRLAQQYAISKRKKVALLLPQVSFSPSLVNVGDYPQKSMRACLITKNGSDYDFEEDIQGTEWGFVPDRMLISTTASLTTIQDVEFLQPPGSPVTSDVDAVIFQPDGSLENGADITLSVTEVGNPGNAVSIKIHWITGRVEFL